MASLIHYKMFAEAKGIDLGVKRTEKDNKPSKRGRGKAEKKTTSTSTKVFDRKKMLTILKKGFEKKDFVDYYGTEYSYNSVIGWVTSKIFKDTWDVTKPWPEQISQKLKDWRRSRLKQEALEKNSQKAASGSEGDATTVIETDMDGWPATKEGHCFRIRMFGRELPKMSGASCLLSCFHLLRYFCNASLSISEVCSGI